MAKNQIAWDGLEELFAALRALPDELRDDAWQIGHAHAWAAHDAIKAAYPVRTGNLRDGMAVEEFESEFGLAFMVINRAPHAWIFENGTQARHKSIGATTGSMPAGNIFVPRIIRERRAMYVELAEMPRSHGLEVTYDAAA